MQSLILTVGAPSSGKSTWAIAECVKDPINTIRINNDLIRLMLNNSVFDKGIEKLVSTTRTFLIKEGLKSNKSIILDNVNGASKHWEEAIKLVREANVDYVVSEKIFYEPLAILLDRDSKRTGTAKVGEIVVKKWFKELGGDQLRFRKPRIETFAKSGYTKDKVWVPMVQDEGLERAVIWDNDGTISIIHSGRGPYSAETCDQDIPHAHAIECMRLYYKAGYTIIFVSGREEKDRAPTERFYKQHFPEVEYELYMRQTGDKRKDVLVKEEIFNTYIKDKYFVAGWFDDRLQVARWVFNNGLPLFRLNDPCSDF